MYTAFYGLREKPFSLTPNPRFLYLAESHREALAHLHYGLEQGEGFIVISGEVGTGKTTICRSLLDRLGAETELAFLFNPTQNAEEMLQSISDEFGLPPEGLSRRELLSQLNRFLLDRHRESKRVVLIIDEAQNLSVTTLEQVRLLSNLETNASKLIQIILLGQPELATKLDSDELRQLRQRIGVRWRLSPLSSSETAEYVRHRLRVAAGADRAGLFADAALKEVHRRTGGVPRLINVLCDRAMLAGYAAESHTIEASLVKQAAAEIIDLRDEAFGRGHLWPRRIGRVAAVAAAALLAVLAGVWLGRSGVGEPIRTWLGPGSTRTPAVAAGVTDPHEPAIAAGVTDPHEPLVAPGSVDAVEPVDPAGPAGSIDPESVLPPVSMPPPTSSMMRLEPGVSGQEVSGQSGALLASLLTELSGDESRDLAMAEILGAWGQSIAGASPPSDDIAFARLLAAGLTVHPVRVADLDAIGQFDSPCLLRVHDASGAVHWVALTELRPGLATLAGVVDRGPLGVPTEAVEYVWTDRVAHVIWAPRAELGGALLQVGSEGHSVSWLQEALLELGYLAAGSTPSVYDRETRAGVERFQKAHGLSQDGITGPLTLMRLDAALGRRERPHLLVQGAG